MCLSGTYWKYNSRVTLLRRTTFTVVFVFFLLLLLRWCQPPDVTNSRFVVVNFKNVATATAGKAIKYK